MDEMRRFLLVPALLFVFTAAQPAGAEEAEEVSTVAVPPAAVIRLEPDREHWYLGENVLVRYIVENAGDTSFTVDRGGDSRSVRPIRNIVQVIDEAGSLLEDPWPDPWCFGGPGGSTEVTLSTPMVIEIAVPRYRRFEASGTYRIRVLHDLGWQEGSPFHPEWPDGEGPANDDPRWAETTVVLHDPPPERIDAILDAMNELPKRGDRSAWQRNRAWSDFETLRHPTYLDALVRRARGRSGHEKAWLEGIRSIETPEATQALLELLLEDSNEDRAAALIDRVPPVRMTSDLIDRLQTVGPRRWGRAQETPRPTTWRTTFAEPSRRWARANLGGRYAARMPHYAAYVLASVGTSDDMPALHDGLDQALQYQDAEPKRWEDALARGRLAHLYVAISELFRRGAAMPEPVGRPVDDAMTLLLIHTTGEETLAAYDDRIPGWLSHRLPAIRDLALHALPRPLPPSALDALGDLLETADAELRITVLNAIAEAKDERFLPRVEEQLERANEHRWLHAADTAAVALGLRLAARARIHARALSRKPGFRDRFGLLAPIFGNRGWSSSGTPDAAERRRLSAAWIAFLDEQGAAIDAGLRFDPRDERVAGLIPSTVEVHTDD